MSKLSDKSIITAPFQKKQNISNYVFKTKRLEVEAGKKYDVALVLGCSVRQILINRTEAAIKLYNDGIVQKIILSGGKGKTSVHRTETEAEVMKRIMVESGIPEEDIILEDKSTTTYENMEKTLETIKELCGNEGSIILVTSDFHQKRAQSMFEQKLKKINCSCNIYSYGVQDGKYDIDKWDKSFSTQFMIRKEAALLSYYAKKNIIEDKVVQNIDVRTRK